MIKAFIELLLWFKVIGYSPDELAGITVTVEFPTTYARNRAYSRLLDDALPPPEGARVTLNGGYIVRICGVNVNLTAAREGY